MYLLNKKIRLFVFLIVKKVFSFPIVYPFQKEPGCQPKNAVERKETISDVSYIPQRARSRSIWLSGRVTGLIWGPCETSSEPMFFLLNENPNLHRAVDIVRVTTAGKGACTICLKVGD